MMQIHVELENTAKVNTSAEGSRQPQAEQETKSRKTQRPKRITCDFIRSALDNCSAKCWAECIAVCLFCFQLAMIIAIMVKNFGPGVVSPGDIEGGVSGVLKNLESSPFSDILVASSSCPSGYERLDLGTWPGTEEICTKRTNRVKICTRTTVEMLSFSYSSWKNISICVQRVSAMSNSTVCPTGYTRCYPGVCVQGSQCGVTEVYLEQSARTDSGWYSNNYNNSLYVNYRKDAGVLPISSLGISHGEPVLCVNLKEYAQQLNYFSIKFPGYGCGRYGDFPRTTTLDQDDSLNIFYSQDWTASPVDLPGFTSKYEIGQSGYLLSMKRLEMKDNDVCTTLDLQELHDYAIDLQGFAITILILVSLVTILVLFAFFDGRDTDMPAIFVIYPFLIGIVLIPAAIVIGVRSSGLSSYMTRITPAINANCFLDASAQLIFSDFLATATVVGLVAKLLIAFVPVWWVLYIVFVVLCKRKGYE